MTAEKQIEVLHEGGTCSVIRDRETNGLSLVISSETMDELWNIFVEAEAAVRELPNSPASLPMGKLCSFTESLIFLFSDVKTAYMAKHEDDPAKREAYTKVLEANKMLRKLKKFHRPEK